MAGGDVCVGYDAALGRGQGMLWLGGLMNILGEKNDAARAWIKEAGRMNHLKHSVP